MTLDEAELRQRLNGIELVRRLEVVDWVGSTNDVARELGEAGAETGSVVVADRQDAGRGRLGRIWHSVPGLGLYLSVLLHPTDPVGLVTRWTLGAGVAVCEACRSLTGCSVEIDWPNDVVWRGRKLAGILAEQRLVGERSELVLGIGINVRQGPADFPAELGDRATSLAMLPAAPRISRELLAGEVLERLDGVHRSLLRGDWSAVARRWLELAPTAQGRRVRIVAAPRSDGESFEGVTAGVDEAGSLLVRRASGSVVAVHWADAVQPREV